MELLAWCELPAIHAVVHIMEFLAHDLRSHLGSNVFALECLDD